MELKSQKCSNFEKKKKKKTVFEESITLEDKFQTFFWTMMEF